MKEDIQLLKKYERSLELNGLFLFFTILSVLGMALLISFSIGGNITYSEITFESLVFIIGFSFNALIISILVLFIIYEWIKTLKEQREIKKRIFEDYIRNIKK